MVVPEAGEGGGFVLQEVGYGELVGGVLGLGGGGGGVVAEEVVFEMFLQAQGRLGWIEGGGVGLA